jgi:hypothetical protein
MKHCQWCDSQFETKISYQIYCSPSCREEATKEKIAQRYLQIRRTNRQNKFRPCRSCNTPLSIYNDDALCFRCSVDPKEVAKAIKEIRNFSNGKNIADD